MAEAYVIDAVRTAVGKRNGALAGIHPVDLGALGWRGLLDRVDVDPVQQPTPAERAQIDGMHAGQRSVALSNRSAHSVNDVSLGHFRLLLW